MGFTGPQLVVVSGLFGGNPSMDGIFWATTCCCLRPLWWESLDRWDFGYQEAFFTNFFFFDDGILAIMKPFLRTFSFFTMEFRLSRSLSHELFLFSRWNFGYHGAFLTNFFFLHDGILETRNLGEDSFHIYIRKSVYTGSASLKTLPLDLEPPLQGKEYGPSYSNTTVRNKTNFCSEITYRHAIRVFVFLKCTLTKIEKLLHATSIYN
jgi:hypothetical protein